MKETRRFHEIALFLLGMPSAPPIEGCAEPRQAGTPDPRVVDLEGRVLLGTGHAGAAMAEGRAPVIRSKRPSSP
jgi:hypothetical protein